MSINAVCNALETALNAMTPTIPTAWENVDFNTPAAGPFQIAEFIPADPDNDEYGPNFIEIGFLQLTLSYPLKTGRRDLLDRVDLIRATFRRGAPFTSGGVIVSVTRTPALGPRQDSSRYVRPVRIPYHASIAA